MGGEAGKNSECSFVLASANGGSRGQCAERRHSGRLAVTPLCRQRMPMSAGRLADVPSFPSLSFFPQSVCRSPGLLSFFTESGGPLRLPSTGSRESTLGRVGRRRRYRGGDLAEDCTSSTVVQVAACLLGFPRLLTFGRTVALSAAQRTSIVQTGGCKVVTSSKKETAGTGVGAG